MDTGITRDNALELVQHYIKQPGLIKHCLASEAVLAAGETITGMIMATALVYPDKKSVSVKPKSVIKRMKEKAFAASANRDTIRECELAGIPLDEFAAIALNAMYAISTQLEL